jgi:hypothetical protein
MLNIGGNVENLFAFNLAREVELPKDATVALGNEQGFYDEKTQLWKGKEGVLSVYTCTLCTVETYFSGWTLFPLPLHNDFDHYCDPFRPDTDNYGGPC